MSKQSRYYEGGQKTSFWKRLFVLVFIALTLVLFFLANAFGYFGEIDLVGTKPTLSNFSEKVVKHEVSVLEIEEEMPNVKREIKFIQKYRPLCLKDSGYLVDFYCFSREGW